jgi:hypothetical protein
MQRYQYLNILKAGTTGKEYTTGLDILLHRNVKILKERNQLPDKRINYSN